MNNKNLASHLQNLKTITDFDFGVSDSPKDFSRVSTITTNVTKSEVNFIIWLLLEKELGASGTRKLEEDVKGQEATSIDSPDASLVYSNQTGAGYSHHPKSNLSKRDQVRRYAEDLLAAVGVNIPFERLTTEQRHDLFKLFCASSNLLIKEKFCSIHDLYTVLRRRSKFREEFCVLKSLGTGNFGTVYSVRRRTATSRNTFALKKVNLTLDLPELIPMILNESSILKDLIGNEHIVQFHESWFAMEHNDDEDEDNYNLEEIDSNVCSFHSANTNASTSPSSSAAVEYDEGSYVFYLLMEQCGISLREWKTQFPNELLTSAHLNQIAFELIDGIEWIHGKGYLHLDINLKNILWKNENSSSVVISDFGLAVNGPALSDRVGTTPYCAPERIMTAKSDVYSLGVSLFEMCQHFSTRSEFYRKVEAKDLSETGVLEEMLSAMLHQRHQQRPSASDLKKLFCK